MCSVTENVFSDLLLDTRYLNNAQVAEEVSKCVTECGDGTVVNLEGFTRYVKLRKDMFGTLDLWQDVFNQYVSRGPRGKAMCIQGYIYIVFFYVFFPLI